MSMSVGVVVTNGYSKHHDNDPKQGIWKNEKYLSCSNFVLKPYLSNKYCCYQV